MLKNKINSSIFNFQFFLGGIKKVSNLEAGAIENGGATKFEDGIYSNIETNEFINVNSDNNKLSLFVPDTMDVSTTCDNEYYVNHCINNIQEAYSNNNITFYNTKGSWFSEDLNKVVYDNITIITLELKELTQNDISNFVSLANWIKIEMKQEGVSININGALGII